MWTLIVIICMNASDEPCSWERQKYEFPTEARCVDAKNRIAAAWLVDSWACIRTGDE